MKPLSLKSMKRLPLAEDKLQSSAVDSLEFFDNQIMDERLLTKKEIADFLGISVKTIDKKVYMNEIPYLKVGRLVRFSKQRIRTWLEGTTL